MCLAAEVVFMVIGPKLGVKNTAIPPLGPRLQVTCLPSYLLLCDLRDNSTWLIGLLQGLKEIKHINHFEQCQTQAKHTTNVSDYCYDFPWLGSTWKLAWAKITQITHEWDPRKICFWRPTATWWGRESCPLVRRLLQASTTFFPRETEFLLQIWDPWDMGHLN